MDKWFSLHAMRPGGETVGRVQALMENPSFSLTNPNKVRSLIGAFAMANPTGFHTSGGQGYRFVADQVIQLNSVNPQVASRLAAGFNRWRRYDEQRRSLMEAQLRRIAATPRLSSDVAEIVGKALA